MEKAILRAAAAAAVLLVLVPTAAYAQAVITGTVRDTSGAVLPGVTVEAASPVLIEKVRTVVTDSTGQYRIVNLLPGAYSVTFTLPGFNTVRREGIELTGTFVATVNVELGLGALEETVTVTGESPVVDVQSAQLQQTMSKELLSAIPTARTGASLQLLIPGLTVPQAGISGADVGGASGSGGGTTGAINGARMSESRTMNDGLTTNHGGGGGGGGNLANVFGAQEVVITTSGGLGEAETAGVTVNVIPREGSNTFTGTFVVSGANSAMQSSNYSQALRDRGLRAPAELIKMYDVNPMGGGRIIRDRLWFFVTGRWWGADNTIPGMFINKNAGNPNAWTYEPDLTRQAFVDVNNSAQILRLTWQATPRNKFSGYWSEQRVCAGCSGGGTATQTTEATPQNKFGPPSRIPQATWSSPLTNRVLLEAGFGGYLARFGAGWWGGREDGTHNPAVATQVVEQGGPIPGLVYRFPVQFRRGRVATRTWRASLSYVTGAHNMKFGYFGGFSSPTQPADYYFSELIAFRFNNGVPNQLTQTGVYPGQLDIQRYLIPTAFYAQDQWAKGRLTLQGGVRYDHGRTGYPESRIGGTRLIPNEIVFPSSTGYKWHDITPRMGAAYDLFGTGKTALKFNLGKYVDSLMIGHGNDYDLHPLARIAVSTTRAWNDVNRNYVPECDLANPNANGECGAMANRNLGTATVSRTFDPGFTQGWGNRPFNWELVAGVQHELLPRTAVNVSYVRRWWGNWYVVDNRATSASDYTPFSITAPVDPRLPDGGGYTISGLYNIVPEKVGQVDEFGLHAKHFGEMHENWHGVNINVNARLHNGLTVQGGTNTGRRLADNCAVRGTLPELGENGRGAPVTESAYQPNINTVYLTNPYCRVVEPYRTAVTGLATYIIPRLDLQVSATWQSNPGPELAAIYNAPNSVVRPSLGRDLAGGVANVPVNLIPPGTMYGDRINQVDLRIAKLMRFGRGRATFGVDIYNLTNSDVPLTYNNTFVPGGPWLTPTSVLTARFVRLGAQFDF